MNGKSWKNDTIKATAIGDLTKEKKSIGKKLKFEELVEVLGFAKNIINVEISLLLEKE